MSTDPKATNVTPLSELIVAHKADGSPDTWSRFLDAFRSSQIGVIAFRAPGTAGEHISSAERPISVGLTAHAGGKPMALAFADPEAFAMRFGQAFNATMTGDALLATVLVNPQCAGVLVNSALAELSAVIHRATAESLLRQGGGPQDRNIRHET
jgi:hypothetical protein